MSEGGGSSKGYGYYFEYQKNSLSFPSSILYLPKTRWVHQNLRLLPHGSRVLDAGCGAGLISRPLMDRYRVEGVDREEEAIAFCQAEAEKAPGPKLPARYYVADLARLPVEAGRFDGIIFCNAIEHLEEPRPILSELARVLAPGGMALMTTENCNSRLWVGLEHTWYRFFGGNCKPYLYDVHPQRFTPASFRDAVEEFFEVEDLFLGIAGMEMFLVATKRKERR